LRLSPARCPPGTKPTRLSRAMLRRPGSGLGSPMPPPEPRPIPLLTSSPARLRIYLLRFAAVIVLARAAHLLWATEATDHSNGDRLSKRAWGPADETPRHHPVGEFDGQEQIVTIVQSAVRRRDETYRDEGSEWLLQILASIRGACSLSANCSSCTMLASIAGPY